MLAAQRSAFAQRSRLQDRRGDAVWIAQLVAHELVLYRNSWIGVEFQPGGRAKGLGGDFAGISVDGNIFDFSLLERQRIATRFSAAFNLDPDGSVAHFVARDNRMFNPPAMGIAIGKTAETNRSSNVVFDHNLIQGAGWDPKAPAGERAAVVLRRAAMRNVHVHHCTVVAPAKVAGVFIARPERKHRRHATRRPRDAAGSPRVPRR